MNVRIWVSPAKLLVALALLLAAIIAANLVLIHVHASGWLVSELRFRFDLDSEYNIASWYHGMLLLLISGLMLGVATAAKRAGAGNVVRWRILAVEHAFLSLDETAMLHELLGGRPDAPGTRLRELLGLQTVLYFDWVPAMALLVIATAVLFLPIFLRLPWAARLLFASAALLYLTGTIVVETFAGDYVNEHGWGSLDYHLLVALEESLEGLGSVVAIYGLLFYIATLAGPAKRQVFNAPKPLLLGRDGVAAAPAATRRRYARRHIHLDRQPLQTLTGGSGTHRRGPSLRPALLIGTASFGLVLTVVIFMALAWGSLKQATTPLALSIVSCGDSAHVTFFWNPAVGAASQWLDLSLIDDGFQDGSFLTAGPLLPKTRELTWNGLETGVPHYWRLNAETREGRVTSTTRAFVPCGGPEIRRVTYICSVPDRADVTFSWASASPSGLVSWIDISLVDNSFAPATFLSAGPLDADSGNLTWGGLLANLVHYWRVNTLFDNGWTPSATGALVASCPTGGDGPYGSSAAVREVGSVVIMDAGSAPILALETRSHRETH